MGGSAKEKGSPRLESLSEILEAMVDVTKLFGRASREEIVALNDWGKVYNLHGRSVESLQSLLR